jgi:hypothetical protein
MELSRLERESKGPTTGVDGVEEFEAGTILRLQGNEDTSDESPNFLPSVLL